MLQLKNIGKTYPGFNLSDITFNLEKGEILGLVGESGSGKSTLLRIIAGLEYSHSGSILFHQEDWTILEPQLRKIGFVFQDYALFPHLSVIENITIAASADSKKVEEIIQIVDLVGFQDKMIHQLSGGQQQRVAIARALMMNPNLMLLDEPFSNLDTMLKASVRKQIKQILKNNGCSSIIVTHDLEDAYEMADKIAILKHGKLIQLDTPQKLYSDPVNEYVAGMTGVYSVFKGQIIRPEDIEVTQNGKYKGVVKSTAFKGSHYQIHVELQEDVIKLNLGTWQVKNEGDYINFNIK